MKKIIAGLAIALGFAMAPATDIVTVGGQSHWRDTVKWGGSGDSTSYIRVRGNAVARDSAGTWVAITTDSCSKWNRKERGAQNPIWRMDVQYEVRTSSGNTDSSRIRVNIDSRYCIDPRRSLGCDSIVRQGRHGSNIDATVKDTIITIGTADGTTWRGTHQWWSVYHGNQVRFCLDSFEAGGGTGDTTYFRNWILGYQ